MCKMQDLKFALLCGEVRKSLSIAVNPALTAFLGVCFAGGAFAQSVVVDGGTATTTTIAPSGQITVQLAPADAASISHNTYSDFSVSNSGVNLDNSIVSAGVILNEVTSAKVTTIEGDLNVLGAKADVIVANPNGITVNGGRFLNMRNLALTTGIPARDSNGHITAAVDAGEISIEGGGLGGTMEELALISRSLKIDGPVTHDVVTRNSLINIIAGDNTVSFDPGRVGGGILPWALPTDRGSKTSNAVLVDITRHGSLSSGRIRIAVTDTGAGVRFAGDQLASAGGFRLNHDGHVEIDQSHIRASGSVNIKASSASLKSSKNKRSELVSESSGVVVETENGDLDLGSARLAGVTIASDNLASSGGVTLVADGMIRSHASDYGEIAEFDSSGSSIVVTSGAGIRFDGLAVGVLEDFRLGSSGDILISGAEGMIGEDFRVLADGFLRFDESQFKVQSDIRLDAASMQFGTRAGGRLRTELVADTGGFVAKTTSGDILNFGSLLQGNRASTGDTESLGGLTLLSAGGVVNESTSGGRLAKLVSGSSIFVTADTNLSFDGVTVETPEDFRLEAGSDILISGAEGMIGEDFRVLADGFLKFDESQFKVQSDIRLDAASMQFGTRAGGRLRTELVADTGGFVAKTTSGDILNFGSLLQGNRASTGDTESLGGLTLLSAGGVVNESTSGGRLAVAFGQLDDLYIAAEKDIVNQTGRFFSNADIVISTMGDFLNQTSFVGNVIPYMVQRFKGNRFAGSLFLKRSNGINVLADYGSQAIAGEQSFVLAAGDVSLKAANIRNYGANITGKTIRIDATEEVFNEARQVGFLYFSQRCKFFCKTSGISNLGYVGGNITASNQMVINAAMSVTSIAGRIEAVNDLSIVAPITRFIPLLTAEFIDQKSGVGSFFGSRSGFLVTDYQRGILRSLAGMVTIDGDVDLGGAEVLAGQGLDVKGSQIKSRELPEQSVIGRRSLGLFWNLF